MHGMDERDSQRDDEPVLVYARWAGRFEARTTRAGSAESRTHIYSAAIPPERPLRPGMRVRILATTPAWYTVPSEDPDTYDTYDAHVVGTVTGVVGWKGRKVILEIGNECKLNAISTARLHLPFVPNVTVDLDALCIPPGQREAQEADINAVAVERAQPGDTRCGARTCWMPWRALVGDGFLWEPMEEDIGERPGIKPGRKTGRNIHVGWEDALGYDFAKG